MSSIRRPIALAAAVATSAAIAATAFVLPATAAGSAAGPAGANAQAARAAIPVVGGTLDWGVLESYRTYVTTIAQGEITVADGAKKTAKGFTFGSATGQYDPATHLVTAAFKGSVTFKSAAHRFEVKLANLRIDTGKKLLIVDVTRDGVLTKDVGFAKVAFGGQSMADLGTTLTADAAALLGSDSYKDKAGDPLTAVLEFPPPPSPSPSPSASAPTSPSPSQSASPSASASASPSQSASPSPSKPGSPSASTSSPATGGPQQILSGRLAWGIKESFRKYVQTAGGTVTPADGAVANGDSFAFGGGKGTLDTKARKLNATFAGNLRFQYAAHGIDMTFGNVRINAEGDKGTLVLDVKTPAGVKADIPFATLDLAKADYKTKDGVLALNAVRTALTAEGSAAFANDTTGSMYPVGTRADDVNLTVSVDKDAVLPTTPAGTGGAGSTGGGGTVGGGLAATGSEIPAGALLGSSAAIVAAGAGAVFVARRRRTAQN
ncbi:HtaA domain-containing protein [Streptomyces sp. NBC_01264]|uniref:HtaA domain-containing protein n=1 Tax=Streptomyces sp. NBC_01264 TaxID=2903804 RepID=UPI0022519357|nr:HtaA domain-containing protein [Streptomyces sp. NBC_01264]MCX4778008.1 HtaA domain-containing protein [Streptomyces sp. NBC_01264]